MIILGPLGQRCPLVVIKNKIFLRHFCFVVSNFLFLTVKTLELELFLPWRFIVRIRLGGYAPPPLVGVISQVFWGLAHVLEDVEHMIHILLQFFYRTSNGTHFRAALLFVGVPPPQASVCIHNVIKNILFFECVSTFTLFTTSLFVRILFIKHC